MHQSSSASQGYLVSGWLRVTEAQVSDRADPLRPHHQQQAAAASSSKRAKVLRIYHSILCCKLDHPDQVIGMCSADFTYAFRVMGLLRPDDCLQCAFNHPLFYIIPHNDSD